MGSGGRLAKDRVKSLEYKEYYTLDSDSDFKPDIMHNLNYHSDYKDVLGKQADIIFCLEVFEYIWNPAGAMFTLNNWLKRGGELIVSFPFLYPQHEPIESDYLRYTPAWIKRMFMEKFNNSRFEFFSDFSMIPRYATAGSQTLQRFWAEEKMHASKRANNNLTGCIVHARK